MPRLDERLVTEIDGPALIVEGVVGQDGRATLESVTPIYRYEPPASNQGAFTLRALDEQQNVLAETQFDGLFSDQYDAISPIVPFLVVLPVPDPAHVTLMTISQAGGPILASLERSPSIPTANFDPIPVISEVPLTISWQANDADGDVLQSTLFYSANGGISWQVLGTDLPVNSLTVDSHELPGGESHFLLIVNDGMNEVEVVSAPVMASNRPPVVVIMEPYGTTFESGAPVILQGFSDDVEDGSLPGESFYWSDDLGQIVGQGDTMQAKLPAGPHTITLKVTDTDNQVGSASIDIIVEAGPEDNRDGNGAGLPLFNLPASMLPYLFGAGACVLLLLVGGCLIGGVFLLTGGRKQTRAPGAIGQGVTIQDEQGNWSFWNGQAWQPIHGAPPPVFAPQQGFVKKQSGWGSCLLSLLISGGIGLIVGGGLSLVVFNFFPSIQIELGAGDLTQTLTMGGGGLLATILGLLLLNSGFKAIMTQRAVVVDERHRRHEKRGCSAILNGLGQLVFGIVCLAGGVGLITLAFYQAVLPWLVF